MDSQQIHPLSGFYLLLTWCFFLVGETWATSKPSKKKPSANVVPGSFTQRGKTSEKLPSKKNTPPSSPKTNMEPKQILVVCRCFSFSKGVFKSQKKTDFLKEKENQEKRKICKTAGRTALLSLNIFRFHVSFQGAGGYPQRKAIFFQFHPFFSGFCCLTLEYTAGRLSWRQDACVFFFGR